jgi:2-polyprenyl-6-methoxyphenol hydroxylase-like FAD-dependent oxidoreductase
MVGLCAAMMLARDGHHVTVLERDDAPVPPDPDTAWKEWERRGVNQFRLLHFLLSRSRVVLDAELPEVLSGLRAAGALSFNPLRDAPAEITGGYREEDARFEAVTARRPVAESVVGRAAASTPGLEVRRGVSVKGLLTDGVGDGDAVHVTGVVTDTGERIEADLVIDSGGRRSALPDWLREAGGRGPVEERDECGFVYYGRHFRSADGSLPFMLGGPLQHYDSMSILTLPADNGTWGIGLIASAKDTEARAFRDAERWATAVRSYPLVAHWLDGEPIDDGVAMMAKIEDRHRQYCVDGAPVATGVLAVGDAWACTNPSVGRGISIGLVHAVALRDTLRDVGLGDLRELALAFDRATAVEVEPWYRATLAFDRHRLAEIEAEMAGERYETDDPAWHLSKCLDGAASRDPDLLRGLLGIVGLLDTPEAVFSRPGFVERVVSIGEPLIGQARPGPTRAELVEIMRAAA